MIKVIFIVSYSPPYERFENQPKPSFLWKNTKGEWLGVYGGDWSDLIGKALTDFRDDVEFEIWQNDYRADQICSARINNRLTHIEFPAKPVVCLTGIKPVKAPYSYEMIKYAAQYRNKTDTVVCVPATVITPFVKNLKRVFSKSKIIHYNLVNSNLLLPEFSKTINPVEFVHRFLLMKAKRDNLKSMFNLLTALDDQGSITKIVTKYSHINVFNFRVGFDLDFWQKVTSKTETRKKLGIAIEKYVIVLSQRLIPEYQVDRFIEALAEANPNKDFACFITGHGHQNYEKYLAETVNRLHMQEKVVFLGYVEEEILRDYFTAADLFAVVPVMFGGSHGAVKAMALETPILHVNMGTTYEFLKSNNAGLIVTPNGYKEWADKLKQVIEGVIAVKAVPREKVVSHFSWQKSADELYYAITHAK